MKRLKDLKSKSEKYSDGEYRDKEIEMKLCKQRDKGDHASYT